MCTVCEITLIAILVTVITTYIQKRSSSGRKMLEIQRRLKEREKEYKKAQEEGKEDVIKRVEEEMMKDIAEMYRILLRHFAVVGIIFIPLLLFLTNRYGNATVQVGPFSVPWMWWYIIVASLTGVVMGRIWGESHGEASKEVGKEEVR